MTVEEIDKAVAAFLAYAKDTERPFRQLSDYLALLQSQGWNQTMLREVQAKALDGLAKSRASYPDSSLPDS